MLDLSNIVFANNPKDKEYYETVLENISNTPCNIDTVLTYLNSVRKNSVLRELALVAYEAAEGKKPATEAEKLIEKYNNIDPVVEVKEEDLFVTTDLNDLINSTVKSKGLRWRLDSLNKSLGSLRAGDFGFIFARPETGKTTFLASEGSYMAEQLKQINGGPVIWFNNEEQGKKVNLRVYQATLGVTLEQLYANPTKYHEEFNDKIGKHFKQVDRASIFKPDVEKLLEAEKPGLVIFDQIDKIKGFQADRDDLLLGSIYQWARELAKTYCPVIAVCQADGSGEGVRWLTMANVANAKTSKQAEADWILGIGCTHDQGWENVRFLNVSKNKLLGDEDTIPSQRHAKIEVLIKPQIGRYEDFQ